MTQQMQLTLSKVFDNKEIRAIEMNGELWIPVIDLADAWEVDRTTLSKIINKNPDIFKNLSTVIDLGSSKEILVDSKSVNKSLRLVNERGTVILALKVSATDLKNRAAKEKVIEFQLWVPELISDLRKGLVKLSTPVQLQEPVQVLLPAKSAVEILKEQFAIAKVIVDETGLQKELADTYAVTIAGEQIGIDFHRYISAMKSQSTPQLAEVSLQDQADYDSHFSLTKIAEFLRLPRPKVHKVLEDLGIIYLDNGFWKLTKMGEDYGKTFRVKPWYPFRSTEELRIRYNPLLLDLLKKYFEVKITDIQKKVS